MNNDRFHARRRGFTLIEVLIAVLILGIVIAAVSGVIRTGVRAWRTGHGASELGQTMRITQDVVMRDLDNMYYMTESSYNIAFRAQLDNLTRIYGAQIGPNGDMRDVQRIIDAARSGKSLRKSRSKRDIDDGEHSALDDISLETIAPPMDLSFRGAEARLSFTRTYRPRFTGDQDTGGIRRVTYFVRDKVLYRREEDPYGLRPGSNAAAGAGQNDVNPLNRTSSISGRNGFGSSFSQQQQYDPVQMIRAEFEKLYAVPDDEEQDKEQSGEAEPASKLLPNQVKIEEPICSGVESFKIKYGYFKDGDWTEDQSWDSQSSQHRNPPRDDEMQNMPGGMGMGSNIPGAVNQAVPGMPPGLPMGQQYAPPDDLPGYITVQFGVTLPDGKGRPCSFMIHHSLPRANETDVLQDAQDSHYSTRNYHSNFGRK